MNLMNPYINRNKLPIDSDMFFGRDAEMGEISGLLSSANPQCVSIVGERRIGKSSLAFRLFHNIKERGDTLPFFIDCHNLPETCTTADHFFQLINKGLLKF